jgi:hypothetical protein
MNRISIVESGRNPRLSILIDDRPLAEHFVGRRGAHPSQVFVLGWGAIDRNAEQETIQQLLGLGGTNLESGRVPLLVCEECGDVACGALAVRIDRQRTSIVWSDWAYENGYEAPRQLEWPTYPQSLQFDLSEYERVFGDVAASG